MPTYWNFDHSVAPLNTQDLVLAGSCNTQCDQQRETDTLKIFYILFFKLITFKFTEEVKLIVPKPGLMFQ